MNNALIAAALAGVFTTGAIMPANAQDQLPATKKTKCYGIAKAGKNDCKSASGGHSCAGKSKNDNDPNEWKMAYPATCVKQGGRLTPPEAD